MVCGGWYYFKDSKVEEEGNEQEGGNETWDHESIGKVNGYRRWASKMENVLEKKVKNTTSVNRASKVPALGTIRQDAGGRTLC
jgi:hypothetical protein